MTMIKQLTQDVYGDYKKDDYVYAQSRFSGGVYKWHISKYLSPHSGVKVEAEILRDPDTFVDVNLTPVQVGDTVARLNTSPNTFWLETRKVLTVTPTAIMMAPLAKHGTRVTATSKNTNVVIVSRPNTDLLLKYIMHVGMQEGKYFAGVSLTNNTTFSDEERKLIRDLINSQR